jgi:aspartyl-tRNA(Asn)/glutamyl-tRNA(Gln) amidotransferase subunit A
MGRTVADCAALLQVIAGYDSQDVLSSRRRVPQYLVGDTGGLSGLRIGVIQEFVETPNLDPEVGQAVDTAVDVLRSAGASCEMVSIPYIDMSMFALGIIVWCDGAALNRRLVEAKYQLLVPSTRIGLLAGQLLPAKAYLLARQAQTLIRSQVLGAFRQYDLLVCPTAPKTAPQIEGAARAAAFPAKDEVVKRHADGNTGFAPLAGCPAISVPCGFTESGMPIGLQIAGRPFEDEMVFRAAWAYEQNTEWHTRHPAPLS